MHTVLYILNTIASHVPWTAIVASGFISPLLVGIKKWFSVKSEKVMISLVTIISGVVAALNYLIHIPTHDPTIIAVQAAVVAFMTQPIYFFVVKPALGWLGDTIAAAAAFRKEVQSAAVPTSGLPNSAAVATSSASTTVPVQVEDFSH